MKMLLILYYCCYDTNTEKSKSIFTNKNKNINLRNAILFLINEKRNMTIILGLLLLLNKLKRHQSRSEIIQIYLPFYLLAREFF